MAATPPTPLPPLNPRPLRSTSPALGLMFLSDQELKSIFVARCEDNNTKFSEKLFQRFVACQQRERCHKVMNFQSVGIGHRAAQFVVQSFRSHGTFRVLCLSMNCLRNEGAFAVADLLIDSKTLISLDVSANSIGDEGCAAIFEALHLNQSLVHVSLGSNAGANRNSIGSGATPHLAAVLWGNAVLSEANLSMTEITRETIGRVFSGLAANRALEKLDLSHNNLRSAGAVLVVRAIARSGIVDLAMRDARIQDDVGRQFCNFLQANSTLLRLDLSGNHLGKGFTMAIIPGLANQETLQELDLSHNPLYGRGLGALGAAIAPNQALKVLNVSYCLLEFGAFGEFCQNLKKNTALEKLDLSHNTIADQGALQLAEAIADHPALRQLSLELCEISDEGATAILEAIKEMKLTKLSLKNNLIHSGFGIQKAAMENRELLSLDIDQNDIDCKTFMDITRTVSANMRRHKEEKVRRRRYHKIELEQQDRTLNAIRSEITAQRHNIRQMLEQREDSQNALAAAEARKTTRIEALEQTHHNVSAAVSDLVETLRDRRGQVQHRLMTTEAEFSSLSLRLVRETETFRAESKNLANCEERIRSERRENAAELLMLDRKVKDAQRRYEEYKAQLLMQWEMIRAEAAAKKLEEEAKPSEDAALVPPAKGKRPKSPKGRTRAKSAGGKKGRKGKGKAAKKEKEEQRPATYQFETSPENIDGSR
jgi:Ran GTPase-activating protein (RanGAP) involved in mRNA processing and transport